MIYEILLLLAALLLLFFYGAGIDSVHELAGL